MLTLDAAESMGINIGRALLAEEALRLIFPTTNFFYHACVLPQCPEECPEWMRPSMHRILEGFQEKGTYCVDDARWALDDAVERRTKFLLADTFDGVLDQYEISTEFRAHCEREASRAATTALWNQSKVGIVISAIQAVSLYYQLLVHVGKANLAANVKRAVDLFGQCVPIGRKRDEAHSLIIYWH